MPPSHLFADRRSLYLSPTAFFFNDTATTEIYTLSLHDALPIWRGSCWRREWRAGPRRRRTWRWSRYATRGATRSEEHTSELQSHHDLVCRLLLEKKNNTSDEDSYGK